jgi:hypothetical protein
MTIERLPRAVSDYVAAFGLPAIAVTRDRRLVATRDPHGVAAAWWCEADNSGDVIVKQSGLWDGRARSCGPELSCMAAWSWVVSQVVV